MRIYIVMALFAVTQASAQESKSQRAESLILQGINAHEKGDTQAAEGLLKQSLEIDSTSGKAREFLDKMHKETNENTGSREQQSDLEATGLSVERPDQNSPTGSRESSDNANESATNIDEQEIGGDGQSASTLLNSEKEEDAANRKKSRSQTSGYREIARPLMHKLPDMYQRLGFPLTTPYQLDSDQFRTREQMYVEAARWKPGFVRKASGALFLHYDSNILNVTNDSYRAEGITQQKGITQNGNINFKMHSTPLRRLIYGADVRALYKHYARSELKTFDTLPATAALWASWWNTRSIEANFRYDYAITFRDFSDLRYFSQTHGPQVGAAVLIAPKYQTDLRYSYKKTQYSDSVVPGASSQGGSQHTIRTSLLYRMDNPNLRPYAGYVFDRNITNDQWLISNVHGFELGANYAIWNQARLQVGGRIQTTTFTSEGNDRHDTALRFHAAAVAPIYNSFTVSLEASHLKNTSNKDELAAYHRTIALLVLAYHFM